MLWRRIKNKKIKENIMVTDIIPEIYPFTQWQIKNYYLHQNEGYNPSVVFVNPKTGERKTIVNENREIINFPGVENKEWIESELEKDSLSPKVYCGANFSTDDDNRYIMYWTIQLDGRFWEDETGFGGTFDDEIILYTYIDNNGDFTAPFKVYSIGTKKYYQEHNK